MAGGGGDFGRFAALANGDVEDAKASKPVRLCAWGVGAAAEDAASFAATAAANGDGDELDDANGDVAPLFPNEVELEPALALAHGEVDGCLPPKIRGPWTDANGELVEAYAINPPCGSQIFSQNLQKYARALTN